MLLVYCIAMHICLCAQSTAAAVTLEALLDQSSISSPVSNLTSSQTLELYASNYHEVSMTCSCKIGEPDYRAFVPFKHSRCSCRCCCNARQDLDSSALIPSQSDTVSVDLHVCHRPMLSTALIAVHQQDSAAEVRFDQARVSSKSSSNMTQGTATAAAIAASQQLAR